MDGVEAAGVAVVAGVPAAGEAPALAGDGGSWGSAPLAAGAAGGPGEGGVS